MKNLCAVIGTLLILWLIISWVDVVGHNHPIAGDYQYMPGNAFVIMTRR